VHPYLIHTGHLSLPAFGALAAVGLMAALTLSSYTAEWVGVSPDKVWDAGWFAVIAALVLSRLLLIATNFASFLKYPVLLMAAPSLTPLGLVLTAIATGVWLWMHRLPILAVLDAWAPCATLTWAFLSLGDFFAGSDPGMESGSHWGVTMPGMTVREHPVALYGCGVALALTAATLLWMDRRRAQGDLFLGTLAAAATAQFLLGFVQLPEFDLAGHDMLLDPLQWVSLAMIVIAAYVYVQPRPAVRRESEAI
jgi:phosphatidylglycerol:prolipoprotein diacylglycerol transferase